MNFSKIEKSSNGFKILGFINFDTVMSLHKQGIELFKNCENIHLDFSNVVHVDSSAITLLLNWLRFAKAKHKQLVCDNLPGQLLEIAIVCEVMPFLKQYINFPMKNING
jgi:phospholipid transport system transporter-binding protein